jgi:hypothetical protein
MHVFSNLLNETGGFFFCQPTFSLGLYFRVQKKLGIALSLSQANRIPTVENFKHETHPLVCMVESLLIKKTKSRMKLAKYST